MGIYLYIYSYIYIYTQYKDSHYGMDGFVSEKLGAIPIPTNCKLKGTLCSDELQLGVLYPMLNQTHIRVYCGSDSLFLQ